MEEVCLVVEPLTNVWVWGLTEDERGRPTVWNVLVLVAAVDVGRGRPGFVEVTLVVLVSIFACCFSSGTSSNEVDAEHDKALVDETIGKT